MTKKKNPTKTTEKNLTPVEDPRVRMKEIRAMVEKHLKGKAVSEDLGFLGNLGDLPDNMRDARRVIIALQDLYEFEREKHNKATDHICDLVHTLNGMNQIKRDLVTVLDQRDREIWDLNALLDMKNEYEYYMQNELRQSQQERDAVLQTMKLLNGQNPQSASVNVTVGYSNNKDQF